MLYKLKTEKKTIYRNSAVEVAKVCGCSAATIYTRLGRKGQKSDIINGVEITIVEEI